MNAIVKIVLIILAIAIGVAVLIKAKIDRKDKARMRVIMHDENRSIVIGDGPWNAHQARYPREAEPRGM